MRFKGASGSPLLGPLGILKEEKGGKNFRKIGFVDVDLAEYAGAGPSTQRYILQAYDLNHRLDNSLLQITLNITLREGDLVFQRWGERKFFNLNKTFASTHLDL